MIHEIKYNPNPVALDPIITADDLKNALTKRCETLLILFTGLLKLPAAADFKNHTVTLYNPPRDKLQNVAKMIQRLNENPNSSWRPFFMEMTKPKKKEFCIKFSLPEQDICKGTGFLKNLPVALDPIITTDDLKNALTRRCETLLILFTNLKLRAAVDFKSHTVTLYNPPRDKLQNVEKMIQGLNESLDSSWRPLFMEMTKPKKKEFCIQFSLPEQDIRKGTGFLKNLPIILNNKLQIKAEYFPDSNSVEFDSETLSADQIHEVYDRIGQEIKVDLILSKKDHHFSISLRKYP